MSKIAVHIACWLLSIPLSMQDRTKLVAKILESVNAVPLDSIFEEKADGTLLMYGKIVEHELAGRLREGAKAAMTNTTFKVIREQVASVAGTRGVSQGTTPEALLFYRAALWWGKQENEYLAMLAGIRIDAEDIE